MTLRCKPISYTFNPTDDLVDVVTQYNSLQLNSNLVRSLMVEFETLNEGKLPPREGQELLIPVLLPFVKQHETGKFKLKEKQQEVIAEKKEVTGTKNYRTYPYLFCRPGETIKAVIRLYNDMSLDDKMIGWLLNEFNQINEDAQPPKLGQQVQIPVLLPFCFRHENNNQIFKDDKPTP